MEDNEFDRFELIFVLNSLFQSMTYLKNFSTLIGNEVQRLADTQDEQGNIYEDIENVEKSEEEEHIYEDGKQSQHYFV